MYLVFEIGQTEIYLRSHIVISGNIHDCAVGYSLPFSSEIVVGNI